MWNSSSIVRLQVWYLIPGNGSHIMPVRRTHIPMPMCVLVYWIGLNPNIWQIIIVIVVIWFDFGTICVYHFVGESIIYCGLCYWWWTITEQILWNVIKMCKCWIHRVSGSWIRIHTQFRLSLNLVLATNKCLRDRVSLHCLSLSFIFP